MDAANREKGRKMRRMGVFGAVAVPAFCTKVQNIVERNEGLGINIAKLPLHSPERSFFVEHCTIAWKQRATAEVAALLYGTMFFGNNSRYPRNAAEAGAGLKRFEEMQNDQH
jgi:hypothetical protein